MVSWRLHTLRGNCRVPFAHRTRGDDRIMGKGNNAQKNDKKQKKPKQEAKKPPVKK
jgi:hypothetical protein